MKYILIESLPWLLEGGLGTFLKPVISDVLLYLSAAQTVGNECMYLFWTVPLVSVCSSRHGLKQIKLCLISRAGCEAALRSDRRLCLQSYYNYCIEKCKKGNKLSKKNTSIIIAFVNKFITITTLISVRRSFVVNTYTYVVVEIKVISIIGCLHTANWASCDKCSPTIFVHLTSIVSLHKHLHISKRLPECGHDEFPLLNWSFSWQHWL